ncbi:outer membrane biogenesis protein BamB [Polystyrenella longa]|uniref:Outer membrane biogenesis protein BamB n=1 Tax=Polystyrenella longa TaxID=2528007 RepID=A0A518CNW3_9PLAN|nr:PQQ-binding-like beta-propeller repeat protein [Polystyrenella longa]QDU80920.1 outer membrane biogenesis protein BamB [Polystyrenella longa]
MSRNYSRLMFRLLCLTLLVVSAPLSLFANEWAHWRGPEMNGISRETGLVESWSLNSDGKTGENVLWVSEIGGRSTPVILNDRVYYNCRTSHDVTDPKDKINAQEQVVCLDLNTGEEIWKDVFNVFQTDIPAPRVGWASMVADPETGNVYVHTVSGLFRCYSADGERLWEYAMREDFGLISGYGGRTQTPIIDEDRVIVSFMALNWGDTAKPPPKQTYYAFDKRNGDLLWTSAPGGAPEDTNYSCPIITVIDGTRMLIGGNSDGGIHAIQARTGEPIWGFDMSKRGLNASPVADGNLVYISHGEDNIDTTEFGRIQCIDATGKGNITETGSVWRVDNIKAGYASLLVKDGILYVVADTGKLYAFDSKDGKQLWVHNLGTVGKGSPIWADGKIYVMEVNGNIHIVKPSREKCESLSHVQLPSANGSGMDEIYASPAISDGKVVFVTRDRTICIGKKDSEPASDPIPELAEETAPLEEVAHIKLVPYEVALNKGGDVEYEVQTFDANGRFLGTVDDTEITLGDTLPEAKLDGKQLHVENISAPAAGLLTAKHAGQEATARLRLIPALPWEFGFTGYEGKQVPPTWINAFLKLQPAEVDGEPVMKFAAPKGRPSVLAWLGTSEMKDYVIQADVLLREQNRKLSSIGITNQRYNFIIKGNNMKLSLQSWAPHLRMAKEQKFVSDPDVWYTMKLTVDIEDGVAHVRGKVWERDKEEPEEWTIEADDPHPNTQGAAGLYVYSLADAFIDNIQVTEK